MRVTGFFHGVLSPGNPNAATLCFLKSGRVQDSGVFYSIFNATAVSRTPFSVVFNLFLLSD